ncbi:MAG: metallophosphoesterase, partial [Methanosphaera sp.]|nr:metallophosphoesterase [Methanosphaera sp.]
TSPIELKKHQKIMVRAKGANQNVSIISECDLNGNNINPVVICIDSNEHIYSYEAIEDTYVILSSRLNYINDVFIIDNPYKEIEDTIDGKIQDGYDYSILLNNNSPVVYGGTTLNDYSKDFEQGYFSDGVPSTSTVRIRSANYININQKTKLINLLNDSSYRIFIFNTDNTYAGTTDWITDKVYEYDFLDTKKYKFAFKFNNNSAIIPADVLNKFFILSGQEALGNILKDILDIDTSEYPSYWDNTINEIGEDINDLKKTYTAANNEIATFFLIGDPHYPSHNYVTSKLIKYLSKKCGINLSICLGDLIQDSTVGHEQNLSRIQDAMNQLQYGIDRMLLTQGNHDNGAGIVDGNGQIKFARVVPDNEWIHHTSSKLLVTPKIVFDELGKAFYYDDMINKIRFISLDSFEGKSYTVDENDVITSAYSGSCTNRQVTWLRDVALNNIPTGYGVITFSHKPLYHPVINNQEIARTELTINGSAVITAINNFKNNGGNYIAHLSGHQHHDFLDNLNNIPQVVNLNDGTHWRTKSYWGDQADLVGDSPLKISGTTNECAFDAVIINKTTRHVDLIRIGAGTNREFNY